MCPGQIELRQGRKISWPKGHGARTWSMTDGDDGLMPMSVGLQSTIISKKYVSLHKVVNMVQK